MDRKLTLDLDALTVDSFGTAPETGAIEPNDPQGSRIVYTVYIYYETEQLSCGCGPIIA